MSDISESINRFEELCTGYVLNALEPDEVAEFEALMAEADEGQRALFEKLRATSANLAFATDPEAPPEAVKERLLQVIEEDRSEKQQSEPSESGQTSLALVASFALLLVTLSLLFYALNLRRDLQQTREELSSQQQQMESLREDLSRKEELLSILEARDLDIVVMRGMEASPQGYGKIIWDADRERALLQVSNLPAVPPGKEYQLWILTNNKPISAGLFSVQDPDRDAFFKIEWMEQGTDPAADAFTVTLEPEGGMPEPTGEMYLMGNREN